jgi:hypothetical protein
MPRAPVLAPLLIATATAAGAEDGATGPARWLLERRDEIVPVVEAVRGNDPLSRFLAHVKRNPVGVKPLVTLLPPESNEAGRGQLPTLAIVARARGRTLISLTRQARADDGQDVVMQRTIVSDLLAGQRFSLTVYEDHAISEATTRLMGLGTRVTYRPSGWPFRVELMTSYDLDAGASGFLAITSVFGAPPVPVVPAR